MMLPVSKREAFTLACVRHLGDVVVWGGLDCSDLVARGELVVGLPDRRGTHRAQDYADSNQVEVEAPLLGDLGFCGRDWAHVGHVVICTWGRQVLSADGATEAIRDWEVARGHPGARVRLHPDLAWYRSAPFLGWRRHLELDV